MTQEQRTEALRKAVQDWLDEIPGNKLVFGYEDAGAAIEAIAANATAIINYADI